MLDLFSAWLEDPELFIAYHRGNSEYSFDSRYNKIHITRTIIKVIDYLIDLGFVENHPGYYDESTGISYLPRMKAMGKAITAILGSGLSSKMVRKAPNTECIILRKLDTHGKKRDDPYIDTVTTNRILL